MLPGIDGAIGSRRTEEAFCGARDCGGKFGIVWTALYHRLPFDECLVFAIQIKPRLDGDRTVYAKPLFIYRRTDKIPDFSPGVGV